MATHDVIIIITIKTIIIITTTVVIITVGVDVAEAADVEIIEIIIKTMDKVMDTKITTMVTIFVTLKTHHSRCHWGFKTHKTILRLIDKKNSSEQFIRCMTDTSQNPLNPCSFSSLS